MTDTFIWIDPLVIIDPDDGPGGASITFEGYGYLANARVEFYNYDDYLSDWNFFNATNANENGTFIFSSESPDFCLSLPQGDQQPSNTAIQFMFISPGVHDTFANYSEYHRGLKQVKNQVATGYFGNNTDFTSEIKISKEELFTIIGNWFHPGQVYLKLDNESMIQDLNQIDWEEAINLGSTTANQTGFFETSISIPECEPGHHYIGIGDHSCYFIIKIDVIEKLELDGLTYWNWQNDTTVTSITEGDVDFDGANEIVTAGYYNDGQRDVAQLVIWNSTTFAVENLSTW